MNLLLQSNNNSKFISIHRETGKSLGLFGGSGLDDTTVNNIQQLLINE